MVVRRGGTEALSKRAIAVRNRLGIWLLAANRKVINYAYTVADALALSSTNGSFFCLPRLPSLPHDRRCFISFPKHHCHYHYKPTHY